MFDTNVISVVAVLINATIILVNFRLWTLDGRKERTRMISDFMERFLNSKESMKSFYLIEHENLKKIKLNSEDERDLDYLLRTMSYLAICWRSKLITTEDIGDLKYYFIRVGTNQSVKEYLNKFKTEFIEPRRLPDPYESLRDLIDELLNSSGDKRLSQ